MQNKPPSKTLSALLDMFDNLSATARAMEVSRQTVQNWQKAGAIPWAKGEDVERATNGAIKARDVWEDAANARKH